MGLNYKFYKSSKCSEYVLTEIKYGLSGGVV